MGSEKDAGPVSPSGAAESDAVVAAEAALLSVERERDDAEASRDRFSFLAEVSRCLAESIDYEATLTAVAGMSLPYLDAWCIVDVVTSGGGIRRLTVQHPDPSRQDAARALHARYPPRSDDLLGAPRVIRTGRLEMVFDVPDAALKAAAHDADHLALLRRLGVRSYVIVPMVTRGRTLGAITFITADSSRRFGTIDVVTAEDLARRAAIAIDNARLHAQAVEARRIAEDALAEAEAATEAVREARDQAESALKVRSDFLATMTHEVRTPLNAVIGYMQLLELDVTGDLTQRQRTYVERTRDSTRHLLRLVEDVLDLSKSEAGQLEVARDEVPAAEAARAALAVVRPLAAGKLVTLEGCSGDGAGVYCLGDEHRIRQILINLLSNSIKFTAPGGRVILDCTIEQSGADDSAPDRRWVLFHVRDTGRGVTPGEVEAIFEPFVQGAAGLTRPHGGSGLGLSISRRLARLMGGDVIFEGPNDPSGRGATFMLRLPAADRSAGDRDQHAKAERDEVADRSRAGATLSRRKQRASARRGLAASSESLLRRIAPTVEEFVLRARADDSLGVTDRMTDVEIADHLATLLTDVAHSMALLGEADGEPTDPLTDGSKIQRLIGELHGAQRHRLGWTEDQLIREGELIGEVCEEAIARSVADDPEAAEAAMLGLSRLLQERMRSSLTGYREASASS